MAGEYEFFQQLVGNTQLGSAEYADAAGKHDRVRRCLNRWYYNHDSGSANSLLVGSYGKNTEIAPPSDIDILFVLPLTVYARFSSRTGNVQSQLLQEVKGVLEATFPTTRIRGDGQIVSVPFVTFAVEVLPAFENSGGYYTHPDANGGGRWRATNPLAEMTALTQSNTATGGKTIHLVKLAKAWKGARSVNINSFVLELAAVRFLATWVYNRTSDGTITSYTFYDWMLRDFFVWLGRQTNQIWSAPGTSEFVSTGDAWEAQARFAANAATRACGWDLAQYPKTAADEWRNIFGTYTP